MTDRYQQLVNAPVGRQLAGTLGLPTPPRLRRYEPGQSLLHGDVLLGGDGRLRAVVQELVERAEGGELRSPDAAAERHYALVYDATRLADPVGLRGLYDFFSPVVRSLTPNGRVLVLGADPAAAADAAATATQAGLEGFVRALAKEVREGATAQLVRVAEGAEQAAASTLRFLLSARSAYVSGQVVAVAEPVDETLAPADWQQPLEGKVAVVTGASRGIGESIAEVLARDGAHVVCVDVPAQGEANSEVANRLGGETLALDVTGADAPATLVEHLRSRHDGVDVVVHNAGITRDKTLARMSEDQWEAVLAVNLDSQVRANDALLDAQALREGGRIVGISSIAGIAGNRGQTNYSTSKAGVIGLATALAERAADAGATVNAVAPAFIETEMTGAMPLVVREAGRRMNSMSQGGLPVDVAETVAWLASPGTGGVNGQAIRVCGQSLLGA